MNDTMGMTADGETIESTWRLIVVPFALSTLAGAFAAVCSENGDFDAANLHFRKAIGDVAQAHLVSIEAAKENRWPDVFDPFADACRLRLAYYESCMRSGRWYGIQRLLAKRRASLIDESTRRGADATAAIQARFGHAGGDPSRLPDPSETETILELFATSTGE